MKLTLREIRQAAGRKGGKKGGQSGGRSTSAAKLAALARAREARWKGKTTAPPQPKPPRPQPPPLKPAWPAPARWLPDASEAHECFAYLERATGRCFVCHAVVTLPPPDPTRCAWCFGPMPPPFQPRHGWSKRPAAAWRARFCSKWCGCPDHLALLAALPQEER